MKLIHELFENQVTRDIPPVVYFHEQSPEKLKAEVSEYIITGGWPEAHPNHKRVPDGIHEQYLRLLTGISNELDKKGGPELPAAWISGFYGSGKSSFAKLLGFALDGVELPGGKSVAEAWLERDTSPRQAELRAAWDELRAKIEPLAVVFDVGSSARDHEHLHAVALWQVQRRLGYCSTEPLVADFELKLERDGEYKDFEQVAAEVLGKPWSEVKDKQRADDDFSLVLSRFRPEHYPESMTWIDSRAGTHTRSESPEEAAKAIRDMLRFRRPGATLFLVVDEVSQYVLGHKDRVDRMRAFATALGATLKGQAWLLALGQQKLDENAGDEFLVWAKDRFPQKLQVHLAATNIRDVVHRRLLQKKPQAQAILRQLFERHRPDLKLYAYGCEQATPEEFVEVYPMLPGQIDLILQITSALRTRSSRAQGDDQAIRGLLQLLGELFRNQKLAEQEVGALVTLDQIYEVQHTALDSDIQASMARVLDQCADDDNPLLVRAAKAVALLELIQETEPTTAKLVAQSLFDRVDRGNQLREVTAALEELRRRNLLGHSEKDGYKVQSSAGEEWERERRDIGVSREQITEIVSEALKNAIANPARPKFEGRPFPWAAMFSDGRRSEDVILVDPRDDAAVRVDFRLLTQEERGRNTWVKRSDETALKDRLIWLAGDPQELEDIARQLQRSRAMIRKYKPRRESLGPAKRVQLQNEENRVDDLDSRIGTAVEATWMKGAMYFRGQAIEPIEHGASFAIAVSSAATKMLPSLYPKFISMQIQPSELSGLLRKDLAGISPKFMEDQLGILQLDSGRYVVSCGGMVPQRIYEHIDGEGGVSGTGLLAHFGSPPYGYTANVVKTCVAGLLRADKLRIVPEGGTEITGFTEAGVQDLFDKDRGFRKATYYPAKDEDIGPVTRHKICQVFDKNTGLTLDRENHAIADAVTQHFPQLSANLRRVQTRLDELPGPTREPEAFAKLNKLLEDGLKRCRQTMPTVQLMKKRLDVLRDAWPLLKIYDVELTGEAIASVRAASDVLKYQAAQLDALGVGGTNLDAAKERISEHLRADHPWQGIGALDDDLAALRAAYASEREQILGEQGAALEAVRARIKRRKGFSTLTGEQSNRVLRPIAKAAADTTPDAVFPALLELKDRFELTLARAESEADTILDEILSEGETKLVRKVNLSLRNRELSSEAEVKALVKEIEERLLAELEKVGRIRLV